MGVILCMVSWFPYPCCCFQVLSLASLWTPPLSRQYDAFIFLPHGKRQPEPIMGVIMCVVSWFPYLCCCFHVLSLASLWTSPLSRLYDAFIFPSRGKLQPEPIMGVNVCGVCTSPEACLFERNQTGGREDGPLVVIRAREISCGSWQDS